MLWRDGLRFLEYLRRGLRVGFRSLILEFYLQVEHSKNLRRYSSPWGDTSLSMKQRRFDFDGAGISRFLARGLIEGQTGSGRRFTAYKLVTDSILYAAGTVAGQLLQRHVGSIVAAVDPNTLEFIILCTGR